METCYSMHRGILSKNAATIPCGVTNTTNPHVTCCVRGDYCMSDSICHFSNPNGDEGYYRADCTDPTLRDPACATRCGGRFLSDIEYNSTTGFWSCCTYDDDGKANCDEPSSEMFPGPAPDELVELQYIPEEGTPTYAVATTNSTTGGEVSGEAALQDGSQSSSVSIGAAVGGGVGAGVVLFLICALAFFLVQRRQRRRREQESMELEKEEEPHTVLQGGKWSPTYELGNSECERPELQGSSSRI
ncbi:hypothetical protein BDW59DRAFT_143803 [Aspergillus cavernicola]|uniref:Mid2 domain-containing protein n=1 Tax=Aspergillus cavernicola TaxID=176166 RepID=A0ABR4IJ35_9EURO